MNQITFSHPAVSSKLGDLIIGVKPDQIVWSYGLNTANYSTYGGEVVQILSMYVEDMVINGTVGSYAELERIYTWFIAYMQEATQGHGSTQGTGYDTRPVKMTYHQRSWNFDIYPKALPGFRYGREVVAPVWTLTAAVSEFPENFEDSVLSNREFAGIASEGGFDPFGTVTAEIGFNDDNPFSRPDSATGKAINEKGLKDGGDWYGSLIKAYIDDNDWSSLSADYSIPKWMQIERR